MRLTMLQRDAMCQLLDGHFHGFGSGFGRVRVALRALHLRNPDLLVYERDSDGMEHFQITDAGRAVLAADH